MRRLLGLRDLVHDAIDVITTLVEETHEAAAKKPVAVLSLSEPLGRAAREVDEVRHGVARAVFDGVRGANRGVQALSDQAIAVVSGVIDRAGLVELADATRAPEATLGEPPGASALETWVDRGESALNGVIGDFLAARSNPLATKMALRHRGRPLSMDRAELARALPAASGTVCVFIHGLGCSDSVWMRDPRAADTRLCFGDELSRALGYTPLYLRYNSGLHISENGRELAGLLSELVRVYPVALDRVVLVGHSMGGLVARSAVHYGNELDPEAFAVVTHVLSIASPHLGAPLARASHVVSSVAALFDVAGAQVPAKVLRARSAGLKDLAFGSLVDDDWLGRDTDASLLGEQPPPVPFVAGVAYGYVAARYRAPDGGPFGEWLGDLLVQLPSASGQHREPARRLPFHMGHVVDGAHHAALTTHPEVYRQLERFLTEHSMAPPVQGPVSG